MIQLSLWDTRKPDGVRILLILRDDRRQRWQYLEAMLGTYATRALWAVYCAYRPIPF